MPFASYSPPNKAARLSTTTPCVNTEPLDTNRHGVFMRPPARLRSRAVTALQCNQQRLVGHVSLSGVFTLFKARERHPEAIRSTVTTLVRSHDCCSQFTISSPRFVFRLCNVCPPLDRHCVRCPLCSVTVCCAVSFT
jgi:hypothetical protein